MHAVPRLVFNGLIDNIQASWVKMGKTGVQACLTSGANDVGGTLMNESITRAAGAASHRLAPAPAAPPVLQSRKQGQGGLHHGCCGAGGVFGEQMLGAVHRVEVVDALTPLVLL